MTHDIWLYILVASAVTLAIKILPLTLIRGEIKNRTVRSFLHYVPYVTLAVMTFPAIIDATKDFCNLVWLENLNLRGNFKPRILDYIREKFPNLLPLYNEIYREKNLQYWLQLHNVMCDYAAKNNLEYVRNRDDLQRNFDDPPVIVNFFFHELIKKTSNNFGR